MAMLVEAGKLPVYAIYHRVGERLVEVEGTRHTHTEGSDDVDPAFILAGQLVLGGGNSYEALISNPVMPVPALGLHTSFSIRTIPAQA